MQKVVSIILGAAFTVLNLSFDQGSPNPTSYTNGKSLYATYCMSCHMEDGTGVEGVFPSLVKTGNLADKNKLAKIILQGMRGPIVVKGVTYNGEMAPLTMTDQEVADVINYFRNSWGNKYPYLKAADVVAAKKAVVKGYQPY